MASAPAFRFSITISLSQTRPDEMIGVVKRSEVHLITFVHPGVILMISAWLISS